MKIVVTQDSPVLLKLIPETTVDGFHLGSLAERLKNSKRVKVKENGVLLVNVDSAWGDFEEHGNVIGEEHLEME